MKQTNTIINNFVEALTERAEMSGDGRLEYAMGYLYSTLKALKLQSYELEILERDTEHLKELSAQPKMTFTYFDDETKTKVTRSETLIDLSNP